MQKDKEKGPRTKKGLKKEGPKKLLAIVGRGGYNSREDAIEEYQADPKEAKEELEFDLKLQEGTKLKVNYYLY